MRRAVRKSSGVWVCMAPRKEKSAQENEVERGCVGSLVVARAAPGATRRRGEEGQWGLGLGVYSV